MLDSIGQMDFTTPAIMGILNVTPDSFFDGGKYQRQDSAIRHATQMAKDGAIWIDVGGESTKPGAKDISVQEELDRVIPVIEAIVNASTIRISIDTSKPEVMLESIKAGATLVNDVYALQKNEAKDVVIDQGVNVCLMHIHGELRARHETYSFENATVEIKSWLKNRLDDCIKSGILKDKIILDPGFGFGKSDQHNFELIKNIGEFASLGVPVLIGSSRKSSIGRTLNRELPDRLAASLALSLLAMQNGASILRVHDVRETLDVIKMVQVVNCA